MPRCTKESVARTLDEFKRANPGFDFVLTVGDTRETLPKIAVDFAYIDGGRSLDAIRSAYEKLKASKVILFDDYFEGGSDAENSGCNNVVKNIAHKVLPVADPVSSGGVAKLAVTGI